MLKNGGVPRWELLVYTPGVFVRVANAGVTGYGRWKSIRRMEGGRGRTGSRREKKTFVLNETTPAVFASLASARDERVASKEVTGYGRWKCIRKTGYWAGAERRMGSEDASRHKTG